MSNNEIKSNKSFEGASNKQEKLVNGINSIDAKEDNLNIQHNTKRQELGPNTRK